MGCGCKSSGNANVIDSQSNSLSNKKLGSKIVSYTFKVLAFLLFIVFLPLVNLALLWFVFKMLVINEKVDLMPLLVAMGKKFDPRNLQNDEDDDDDEFYSLTEDDVILLDTEDITNKVNDK